MEARQRLERGAIIARHRHADAYAAVVLEGGYHEAGDAGRWCVVPGDVLLHGAFASHLDRIGRPTVVLNLPLMAEPPGIAHARAADPDLLARVGERDPAEAAGLLLEQLVPGVAAHADCVDRLAATLAEPGAPSIGDWARIAGTRRETVFRRFRAAFGVSPTRYRLERRALGAWREIVRTAAPLAEIAARLGFADQAHMTRAVRALTGAPPSAWRGRLRAQPAFKTPPTRPA